MLGVGCLQPAQADDIHLFKDAFACVVRPYQIPGLGSSVPAISVTTLLSAAPKVLLNFVTDDYGVIEERSCGCEFETYGYTTHIRNIRSYGKFTSEGATLIAGEMQEILEQVLPARFGGSPLDYQVIEQEDSQGLTRLYLVISPRIEIENELDAIQFVLKVLRESSSMADAARSVWQRSQTIQIQRAEPIWTSRGKLMPLHLLREDDAS